MIGPLVLSAGHEHAVSSLPLLNARKKQKKNRNLRIAVGTLPPTEGGFAPGRVVEVRTWICPGSDGVSSEGRSARYVSRDGRPLAQLAPDPAEVDGACRTIVDRIATRSLGAGSYRYHLMWMPDEGPSLERTVDFDVAAVPEALPRSWGGRD